MSENSHKDTKTQRHEEEIAPEFIRGAESTETEIDKLKNGLEEKNKELTEQKNKLLRCLADFDNYKKRSAAERSEVIKFSNELFVLELLPIIDNFERAIKASEEGHPIDEITKGIALVKRQIIDTFKKMGVEEIESIGKKFDPHFHEAVMSKEDKSKEDHTVLEEMQKGYTFHGKLIRPAMVIISKK